MSINYRSRPETREVQAYRFNHLTRSWTSCRIGARLQGQRETLKRHLQATDDPGKLSQRDLTALGCGPFGMDSQVEPSVLCRHGVHHLSASTQSVSSAAA